VATIISEQRARARTCTAMPITLLLVTTSTRSQAKQLVDRGYRYYLELALQAGGVYVDNATSSTRVTATLRTFHFAVTSVVEFEALVAALRTPSMHVYIVEAPDVCACSRLRSRDDDDDDGVPALRTCTCSFTMCLSCRLHEMTKQQQQQQQQQQQHETSGRRNSTTTH
jgi:hypothetical protein